MKKALPAAVALLALLATKHASASLVTVEANAYTPGTDISNVIPGINLSALFNYTPSPGSARVVGTSDVTTIACTFTAPYDLNDAPASCTPGSSLFTPLSGGPFGTRPFFIEDTPITNCFEDHTLLTTCQEESTLLKISFSSPTDFFQANWQTENDLSRIYAVDSAGQLLSLCQSPGGGCAQVQTSSIPGGVKAGYIEVLSSTANIAAVYFGGWTSGTGMDSFTYDNAVEVPEPGTLSLLGVGLAAIGLARRKRKS